MLDDLAPQGRYYDEMGAAFTETSPKRGASVTAPPATFTAILGYLPPAAPVSWGVPVRLTNFTEYRRHFDESPVARRNMSFGSLLLSRGRPADGEDSIASDQMVISDPLYFPLAASVSYYFRNGGTNALVMALRAPDTEGGADPSWRKVFDASGPLARSGFDLLCLPGISDPDILAAAAAFCEAHGALCLLDVPDLLPGGVSPAGLAALRSAERLPASPNAAAFLPRVRAADPFLRDPTGNLAYIELPAAPFVAGLLARSDREVGVWASPQGEGAVLVGASGLVEGTTEGAGTADLALFAAAEGAGLNYLRLTPAGGVSLPNNLRTLASGTGRNAELRLEHQRLRLFLERNLGQSFGWAAFSPNNQMLGSLLREAAAEFLRGLQKRGAFAIPPDLPADSDAFTVVCDASTASATDRALGRLRLIVSYRPVGEAEPTVLTLTFSTAPH